MDAKKRCGDVVNWDDIVEQREQRAGWWWNGVTAGTLLVAGAVPDAYIVGRVAAYGGPIVSRFGTRNTKFIRYLNDETAVAIEPPLQRNPNVDEAIIKVLSSTGEVLRLQVHTRSRIRVAP